MSGPSDTMSPVRLLLLAMFALAASSEALGDDYFRVLDGRLLRTGMTRIEVLALAGQPLSKDIETYGIALGESGGRTIETWSYVLEGSVGGMFLVAVTFEAGVVIAVRSKQHERL